jgi:pilus assembly protein CpaB
MGRRTLLLIASILVAALGTALIWLYVQGADTRAAAGETEVPVLVAQNTVAAGTPASQVRTQLRSVPQSVLQALSTGETSGPLTNPAQISGWTATKVVAGLPLFGGQFQNAPVSPPPPVQLDPKKVAMQLSLPDPQRLAGLLQPGSLIRIYAANKPGNSNSLPRAFTLLNKVKVLASGPVTQPSGGSTTTQTVPQANVTLELSNEEMKLLVATQTASSGGNNLWFGLLGADTPDDRQGLRSAG